MKMFAPLLIAAAATLVACSNPDAGGNGDATTLAGSDAAEMQGLKAWGKQLKAEDPETARALVRECMGEGSFFSDEGKLKIARCMKQRYDAGDRA